MQRPTRLSRSFIERVRTAGRYGDGREGFGLSLLVKPRAAGGWSKTFSQRLEIEGKRVLIGLGRADIVTLEEARAAALANKRAAQIGALDRRGVPTFAAAAAAKIALNAPAWNNEKTVKLWRSTLERYVYPAIGTRRVSEITAGDVVSVLAPVFLNTPATARKVHQRVSAIFAYAIAEGHRTDNPASGISEALPKTTAKRSHLAALAYGAVAGVLDTVRSSDAWAGAVMALEFAALTATRSGEVRGARWSEIDLEVATWTIPAIRMKTGTEHRLPLSTRAVEVLEQAWRYFGMDGLVFPSVTGRVMSDTALSRLLKGSGGTVHGLRSSFRDWAAEAGVSRELAEAALAHTVTNATEAAYFRSDLFAQRREIMQSWADFLAG